MSGPYSTEQVARGDVETPVTMTRREAEELSRVFNDIRRQLVANIKAVERKRSWRDSEKAMALGEYRHRLQVISDFHESLKSVHGIGGY
jgi:hypothetical protein